PALFTRRSISPMRANAAFTADSSVTSQPPAISSEATLAPCWRSSATVAAPMPLAPPVTTAALPSRLSRLMRFSLSILAAMFDLVIRGALLLDGLGSPPRRGDLAGTGDRISAVGEVGGSSKSSLDADGLALMPGIIDNHT